MSSLGVRRAIVFAVLAGFLLQAYSAAKPVPASSRSERIKSLPEEERKWLTEFVAPIILPEEEKVFLELTAPYQREAFKQEFWARREKPGLIAPYGPGYRIRYEELRRLADEKYDGWKEDAGRMVLRYGEPAVIDPASGCTEVFRNLEIWTYLNLGLTGAGAVRFLFYRPSPMAPRKIWKVGTRDDAVFQPNSCRKKFSDLHFDCEVLNPNDIFAQIADKCHPPVCQQVCDVYYAWKEVSTRQRNPMGAEIEYARLFQPDKEISIEGLDRLNDKWATTSDPNARTIRVEGPSSETAVATPRVVPQSTPTPAPAPHDLSREEIRTRILLLEKKYKDWLDLAGPLLSEPELSRFLQMSSVQKDDFIRKFWKRHSGSG